MGIQALAKANQWAGGARNIAKPKKRHKIAGRRLLVESTTKR